LANRHCFATRSIFAGCSVYSSTANGYRRSFAVIPTQLRQKHSGKKLLIVSLRNAGLANTEEA
jgi:hypothetical protein